jgi:hypothetical protein
MPTVPSKSVEKIQFFATHHETWAENALEIGTSSAAVAELDALTSTARDMYNAQQMAINAARSATHAFQMAVEAMAKAGANVIAQIRVKAATTDGVYSLAMIPAPAQPSPIGEPGKPTQFSIELSSVGSLTLRWKCKNPKGSVGTMYQIWRRIAPPTGTGQLTQLGVSGEKKFVDYTLPAGASEVMYQVQAFRSTKAGPWAQFNVNFNGTNIPQSAFVTTSARTLIAA